jgi:aspartate aminotransferase
MPTDPAARQPQLSSRGRTMPSSPIRFLEPAAQQARERGRRILHLNIGQPDIETPDEAWTAIRSYAESVLAYSPSAGYVRLRERLAGHYSTLGAPVSPEQVVVTTGGSEAILYGLLALCDPGDELLIPEPFYTNYNQFAHMAGCVVRPVTTDIHDGFHLPPDERFEAEIGPRTRAIVLCNPGNPTGVVFRPDELERMASLAARHGLTLIGDEVYRDFVYDGREHHSVLGLPGIERQAVLIDSMSKRFSACGARVGALVSRDGELTAAVTRFCQARLSPPTLGQVALLAALELGPDYFAGVRERYLRRRTVLCAGLEKIDGVYFRQPEGAFYVIAKLPVPDAAGFCRWLLDEFHRGGETVMLAPVAGFYATPGLGLDEVRIAYVLEEDRLQRSVELLAEALDEYRDRGAA